MNRPLSLGLAALLLGCGARSTTATPDFGAPPATPFDLGVVSPDDGPPLSIVTFRITLPPSARAAVLFVVDHSGSMWESFDDEGNARWEVVSDLTGEVIRDFPDFAFGYVTYYGGRPPQECPVTDRRAAVVGDPFAGFATTPIRRSTTPTGRVVESVVANVEQLTPGTVERRALVLITDGEPNGCGGEEEEDARQRAVSAVRAAFDAGLPTQVISVGNVDAELHFQEMANAGAGLAGNDPRTRFWRARDGDAFRDALDAVVGGLSTCVGALPRGLADLGRACELTVTWADRTLPCGSPEGFSILPDGLFLTLGEAICPGYQARPSPITIEGPADLFE